MCFASDGGHQAEAPAARRAVFDAAIFGNDEACRNYVGEASKKTDDAAIAIVDAAFQHGPKGGGEAKMVVAR